RGVHLRLASELLDALGDAVGVLLFFLRVLQELILDGVGVDSRGHEIMEAIAQHAHQLGSECFVEDGDGLLFVETVVRGHSTLGDLAAGAVTDLLKLAQMTHYSFSSSCSAGGAIGAWGLAAICAPELAVPEMPAGE